MSDITEFFPAASGGGSGTSNELRIFTSSNFNPSNPFGDGTRGISAGDVVRFTMIGGGMAGAQNSNQYQQYGGKGGRCWSSTVTLADVTTLISITIGAGGTGNSGVGGNSTAIQSGGISISTADSYSTFGGEPGGSVDLAGSISGSQSPSYGLAPFSRGGIATTISFYGGNAGGYPAIPTNFGYEDNTGAGGWAQYAATTYANQPGKSGIVIINW